MGKSGPMSAELSSTFEGALFRFEKALARLVRGEPVQVVVVAKVVLKFFGLDIAEENC